VTHTRSLLTHTRSLLTHTRSLLPHTRSLLTHTRSLLPHTRSLLTHTRSLLTHTRSLLTHTRSLLTLSRYAQYNTLASSFEYVEKICSTWASTHFMIFFLFIRICRGNTFYMREHKFYEGTHSFLWENTFYVHSNMQRKYILWYREHILCRGQKSTIIEKR